MTVSAMKVSRWMLGAAVGVACLFIGDNARMRDDASLVARADARVGSAQTARSPAAVPRRTNRRATVHGAAIPFDFGYSAGAATSYGYAPGTYGGVGCYRAAYQVLACPP